MKAKRLCALLLCAAMLLSLLAACGSSSSSSTTSSSTTSSSEAEAASTSEETTTATAAEETSTATEVESTAAPSDDTAAAATVEEEVVIGPDYYYLAEETTEISIMFQYAFFFANFFTEGWQSSPWWDELGEILNCTFVLSEAPNTTYTEKLNLALVSGDAPDMLGSISSCYSTGVSGALQDEIIYDLKDYIKEYAPNYYAAITITDDTYRSMMTDDGEIGVMYNLMSQPGELTDGLWVRQDWLDALGYDVPSTLDELYDFLVACRDAYGCSSAYYQMISTADAGNIAGIQAEGIWNAFGPCDYYLDTDGNVAYGPAQDYYFEYLAYLKKLASEGLFLTSEVTDSSSNDLFAQSNIAICGDSPDNVPDYLALLDDDSVVMTPMAALGEPTEYGDIESYTCNDGVASASLSVYIGCEYPELCVKVIDYLYTDAGSMLASYGIEGLSYEMVDGVPQFTDLIVNNADGIPLRAALGYWTNPGLCALMDGTRLYYSYEDWQLAASDVWASAYTGSSQTLNTGALSLTTAEQNTVSMYKSDMLTYITEFVYGVVFGSTELTDDVIEDYLDTLYNTMHLEEILDAYQVAYGRYMNRAVD